MIYFEILVTITINQYHFTKGILSLSLLHTLKQTKNQICNPLIQLKQSYFKLIKQTKQLQLMTVHQTQLTVKFKEGHARYSFIIMQRQCSP